MIHHLPTLLSQHLDLTGLSTHPAAFHTPTTVLTHGPSRPTGASGVTCVPPVAHMTYPAERRRSWASAHVSTAWQIYYNEQLKRVERKRSSHRDKKVSSRTITRRDSEKNKGLNLPTDAAPKSMVEMNTGNDGQQPDTSPSSEATLDLHSLERRRRYKSVTFEPVKRLRQEVLDHPYLKSHPPLQDMPCRLCDLFPQQPWHQRSNHLGGFGGLALDSCSAAHLHSPLTLRPSLLHSYHYHAVFNPGLLASCHLRS